MASSNVDACMDLQFEFRLAVWNNFFIFFFRVELNFLSHIFLTECVYEYIDMYIYFFLQQKHLQQYHLKTGPISPAPNVPPSEKLPFYLSLPLPLFHTYSHVYTCHVSELGLLNFSALTQNILLHEW